MGQIGTEELLGRTLGRGEYRLVARLGAGGMGAVYEAEQTGLGRRVAVKILWPHLTQESGLAGRFNREARIAARLEHPHILPVYGFGNEGGLLYLVLRLVRGGSLKDRLQGEGRRRPGWSPREALELSRQVLPALDYAHRQGVVHRDLKPDNILLEPSDDFAAGYRVFVSDFGIATLVHGDEADPSLTQTGAPLGTPAYIAPEQVLDQPVDGRADLYAFGVVLFEVLVGHVPYRGQTGLKLAMQHVREPVPSPRELNPRLPAAFEPVLLRALAKDRDDRFPTGAALIAALTEAFERSGTEPAAGAPLNGEVSASAHTAGHLGRAPQPGAAHPVHTPAWQTPAAPEPRLPRASAAAEPQVAPSAEQLSGPRSRPNGRLVMLVGAAALLVAVLGLAAGVLRTSFVPSDQPRTLDPATAVVASRTAPAEPHPWVVGPSELGSGWTTSRESTAGSTGQLSVYEVEYTNPTQAHSTRGFSLFSAASAVDAEAGVQQLRQAAEARGVAFESSPALGDGQPALRGRATLEGDSPRVGILYVFRVKTVAVVVETTGPADQEDSIRTLAVYDAQLQRDRILAGLSQ